MGYPWKQGDTLTWTDLNAAMAGAYAQAQGAQTAATNAQAIATANQANLAAPAPISVTTNWGCGLVVSNGIIVLSATLPYNMVVSSVDLSVGSAGGSFLAQFRANGVTIGNLTNLAVTSSPKSNFAAVAGPSNPLSVGAGSLLDLVISTTTGAPTDAYLCLNGFRTM